MVWKKDTKLHYVNGVDEIFFDKIDGKWDALLYGDGVEHDGDLIASSENFKEMEFDAKRWMKKHEKRVK